MLIISIYMVIKTHWGAEQLSYLLSKYTHYDAKIDDISHSLKTPGIILFKDVSIHNKKNNFSLNVKQIRLEIFLQKIFSKLSFDRIILTEGKVNLPISFKAFPFITKRLKLERINISYRGKNISNVATNMTGEITFHNSFEEGVFQFNSDRLELNNFNLTNLMVKGAYKKNFLSFNKFSAHVNNGIINANIVQYTDNSLTVEKLVLANTDWQFSMSFDEMLNILKDIKNLKVEDMDLINTNFQGKEWSILGLSGKVNDINIIDGHWKNSFNKSELNIDKLISHNQQISHLVADITYSNDILYFHRLFGYTHEGTFSLKVISNIQHHSINIVDARLANIHYQLPANWIEFITLPVTNSITSLHVTNLKLINSSIIDINHNFPFEFTNINGDISNMDFIKQKKWGLWKGKARFNANSGMINQIVLRHPYLEISQQNNTNIISMFNARIKNALVRFTANIEQQMDKYLFALEGEGFNINLGILNQWGWKNLQIDSVGSFNFILTGNLLANSIAETLAGKLSYQPTTGKKETYSIVNGEIKLCCM